MERFRVVIQEPGDHEFRDCIINVGPAGAEITRNGKSIPSQTLPTTKSEIEDWLRQKGCKEFKLTFYD